MELHACASHLPAPPLPNQALCDLDPGDQARIHDALRSGPAMARRFGAVGAKGVRQNKGWARSVRSRAAGTRLFIRGGARVCQVGLPSRWPVLLLATDP